MVEEIDWSVGRILDTLRRLDLAEKTFVFFTSDNGPWLIMKLRGGSAGLLRGGKGSTWEGGVREPALAWWPGTIRAGTVSAALGSTMDLFVTSLKLAGVPVPRDRIIDGKDLRPVLFGTGPAFRDTIFYYRGTRLMAVRKGPWKAHFFTQPGYGGKRREERPPLLFNLEHDPSERFECGKAHPGILADLERTAARHRETVKPVPSQLDIVMSRK